jgi:endonuclease/exonuclease/phosphatase family metal-dependent hydrolase
MPTFSLLTLNCFGVPTGTTRRRLCGLARELEHSDHAIVTFQEVQAHRYRRLLSEACASYQTRAYEPFAHAPKGGLLTLARLPIERARFTLYRSRIISHALALMDWMLHKGVLETQVTLAGAPIVVLNTHLNANYSGDWSESNRYTYNQREQLLQLAEIVAAQPAEALVIACGDFNVPRGCWLYDEFLTASGMLDPLAGDPRPTYRTPPGVPVRYALPIDFAFVRAPALPGLQISADLRFRDRIALAAGQPIYLSDHLGIELQVAWDERAASYSHYSL